MIQRMSTKTFPQTMLSKYSYWKLHTNSNLIGNQSDYFYVEIQALLPATKARYTVIQDFYSRLQTSLKNSSHEMYTNI